MTPFTHSDLGDRPPSDAPAWLLALLAVACGLIVASLYYAQPLVGPISAALGLSPRAAGLIVTLTQVGYAIGLLLIVPLGDRVENRRLVVSVLALCAMALATAALARSAVMFLTSALLIGLGAVAVQILVPYAAHLSPESTRGKTVGTVMSGLMLGIMLARPAASLIAYLWGWPWVFVLAAGSIATLGLLLGLVLPERRPDPGMSYRALIASMGNLLVTTPILRRRAIYHAFLFAGFSLFWTTIPLLLAGPSYRFTQRGIAIFALAGVAGTVSAPIAGRVADRGWERPATLVAMVAVAVSFGLAKLGDTGGRGGIAILVLAALLLDFGVTANLVVGQRAIFALPAGVRSRLNGLYMSIFFSGGAMGSAIGVWAFADGGWGLATSVGVGLPLVALLYFSTEFMGRLPDRL